MIEFHGVSKAYRGIGTNALTSIDLTIERGEFVAVLGPSGAGKTTLLRLIAAIERPSTGRLLVAGQDITRIRPSAVPYLRRKLGLTFQDQKLLGERSALENVMLPLVYTGAGHTEATSRARAALDKVGMREKEALTPPMLSGGEQQRVAIARAIVNRPAILLADEPTANLDAENARRIIEIFAEFHRVGVTVLVATHDAGPLDGIVPRRIALEGGRLTVGVSDSATTEAAR